VRRGTRCRTKKGERKREREKKKRETRRRESGRMDGWMDGVLVKRKIARSSFHTAVPDVSKPGNLVVRSKALMALGAPYNRQDN